MAGRTRYWPKDTAWWRRGRIVRLGREFGAAGPAVIDHLICEARDQGPLKNHDGGVKSDYATLSYGCFVNDDDMVKLIIERAVEIGVLDEFVAGKHGTFECRVSGWNADVNRELANERKREERAVPKDSESLSVPQCPPMSPEVTREVEVEGEGERESLTRRSQQTTRESASVGQTNLSVIEGLG